MRSLSWFFELTTITARLLDALVPAHARSALEAVPLGHHDVEQ